MSLQRCAFCLLPFALLSRVFLGCEALGFFNVHEELSTARDLENRILDLIELPIRYYLRSDVDHDDVDLNLMLGVSIMKGQFMSCSDNSRMSYNTGLYKTHILNTLIKNLYAKFYKNNLMGSTRKILNPELWTSVQSLIHKSNITLPAKWYNKDILANGDSYFRNISDKCIGQVISSCNVTYECFQPEFRKQFFGYALTHQVLYIHILKKMKCNNLKYQNVLKEIIQHKCSTIFKEAQNMANDFKMLDKYKDLFIEQTPSSYYKEVKKSQRRNTLLKAERESYGVAICGMQNMVDFFRPEWFSIIVSSTKHFDCIQHKNCKLSCDSHLTGVSLAALGVYWKFLCYKIVNTYGAY